MRDRSEGSHGVEPGFTLIELLVVTAIVGILAMVAVLAVGGITDRGRKSACLAEVSTVQTAIESYNAKNGAYPTAAVNDNPSETAVVLNNAIGPTFPPPGNRFLGTPLTSKSPSIAAGYRYTTLGSFSGGTCPL